MKILPPEIISQILDQSSFTTKELWQATHPRGRSGDVLSYHLSANKYWEKLSPDAARGNIENQPLRDAFAERMDAKSAETRKLFTWLRSMADALVGGPSNISPFAYCMQNHIDDFDCMLAACQLVPALYQALPAPLTDESLIALASFKNGGGEHFRHASPRLREMDDIVLAAVSRWPDAWDDVSAQVRDREETMRLAYLQDPHAFFFASPRLKNDANFIRRLFAQKPTMELFQQIEPLRQRSADIVSIFKDFFIAEMKRANMIDEEPDRVMAVTGVPAFFVRSLRR